MLAPGAEVVVPGVEVVAPDVEAVVAGAAWEVVLPGAEVVVPGAAWEVVVAGAEVEVVVLSEVLPLVVEVVVSTGTGGFSLSPPGERVLPLPEAGAFSA